MRQGEVQAVDLGLRIEPVQPALVTAEVDHEHHVTELVRGPRVHVDNLPDPHAAQLDEPRTVAIRGEPRVRVLVEVDLQVLAPLVERGRRHQARRAAGRVLADQEGGSRQPREQFLPGPGRRVVQRPHHGVKVRVVPGQVKLVEVQVVVGRQDDVQDLGDHIGRGEVQRRQKRLGHGGVRDGAPHRGHAAGARAGQVHGRPALRVEGRDLAAVLEPDDRLSPGRARPLVVESRCPPQPAVRGQEGVQPRDPLIRLRLEKIAG